MKDLDDFIDKEIAFTIHAEACRYIRNDLEGFICTYIKNRFLNKEEGFFSTGSARVTCREYYSGKNKGNY